MKSEKSRLIWSPQAERDLVAIWRFGASHFSPETADRHLRDIHASALALRAAPYNGRQRDDLRPGVRELVVYPSVLFYRVRTDAVQVIRVLDGRRNLAALFGKS